MYIILYIQVGIQNMCQASYFEIVVVRCDLKEYCFNISQTGRESSAATGANCTQETSYLSTQNCIRLVQDQFLPKICNWEVSKILELDRRDVQGVFSRFIEQEPGDCEAAEGFPSPHKGSEDELSSLWKAKCKEQHPFPTKFPNLEKAWGTRMPRLRQETPIHCGTYEAAHFLPQCELRLSSRTGLGRNAGEIGSQGAPQVPYSDF